MSEIVAWRPKYVRRLDQKGKPIRFNTEIANTVIERLINGESLNQICRDEDMPSSKTVYRWTNAEAGAPSTFQATYARARMEQANQFAMQIMDIADSMDETVRQAVESAIEGISDPKERRKAAFFAKRRSVEACKLQIDARKWTCARMNPTQWGDRVALTHNITAETARNLNMAGLSTQQLEQLADMDKQITATAENTDAA